MTNESSLREQQRWFALASTHPGGALAGTELAASALTRPLTAAQCLTDGPRLSALERLQIYNDAYFARLEECLVDDYPALAYALGESEFSSLARAYIDSHPSRSPSLNAYGAPMVAFCRSLPTPWAAFAAELARLEWALVEVVHARSTPSLTADALAKIPAERWATARLTPSATLRVLRFEYPVNEYFQAFRDGRTPALPDRRSSVTAVYRQDPTLWRMDLEPAAAGLLEDLVAGLPLASAIAALERTTKDVHDLGERLQSWLGTWVANGFFGAVTY
jgi:hypothetical protein